MRQNNPRTPNLPTQSIINFMPNRGNIDLPSGTVTFLFTDIEGSTKLAQGYSDALPVLLARHNEILNHAIQSNNGFVFRVIGDSLSAAFHTATDALNAALEAQRLLLQEPWSPAPIKVRIGIHTGEAQLEKDSDGFDYSGYATLALTQRIMSVGHGGQILLSQSVFDLTQERPPENSQLIDMGERQLKDVLRLERIYQLVAPGLQSDFPPLNTLEIFRHNLPTQLTSFIGRERELAEAKQKLAGARLLTLIGPGGTGKTRISLQLANDLLSSFRDGVWLIELAPITEPSLILQAIATVFGVREQPGMPLEGLVLNYLRDKHLLLILDNCEHLVETCAQLADQYLHHCPNIKIVASSREALGINGETVYRVPSLGLPDPSEVTHEALMGYESIQLFVERASAANPNFRLGEKNASPIAQICLRLDGIPLAIELAAARVTVFSAEQIAARLDDRFKLLTGGSRTALPRQQTLRALIDWSYDILSKEEQALLRRLSVFTGGWSFEGAEAICADLDVLELLTQLINKSLVVVEEGNQTRYRLLETIRQYARDKLLESGEGEDVRDKHLAYFLELVETAEPNLESFRYLPWAAKLNTEYDNIRTAIEWGLAKDIEAALRFIGALGFFWTTQGYSAEGNRWAQEVLERAKSVSGQDDNVTDQQLSIRAKAFLSLSRIATDLGDNETVRSVAGESVALARKTGDKQILSLALAYLASGKGSLGEGDEAYKLVEESLVLAREQEVSFALGFSLVMMGQLRAIAQQDYEGALAYGEEAIAVLEAGGNRWGSAMTTFGLGFFAKTIGDFEQARARFRTCLPVFLELGDKHRINMIQSELAHIEREQGQYRQAIPMYRETILEWQRLGHRAAIAHQLECFAFIAKAQEQPERAAKLLGAAEALREKINIAMMPQERIEYEREVADLRAGLDESVFNSAWAQGRAMTMEEAIEVSQRE